MVAGVGEEGAGIFCLIIQSQPQRGKQPHEDNAGDHAPVGTVNQDYCKYPEDAYPKRDS